MFDTKYFLPFGELECCTKINKLHAFKGIIIKKPEDVFLSNCEHVLAGNVECINMLVFNNVIDTLSNDVVKINELLILAIDKETSKFSKIIQDLITTNNLSLSIFLIKYNEYLNNIHTLKQMLFSKSSLFKTIDNKHILSIYSNYILYHNVINKLYTIREEQKFLYQILLENMTGDLYELVDLHNIVNYFVKMSHTIVKKYEHCKKMYFNDVLNDIFYNCDIIKSQSFLDKILIMIDTEIMNKKNYDKDKNIDTITRLTNFYQYIFHLLF